MAAVARRPVRRMHLDASVVPVEHALQERAQALDELAEVVSESAPVVATIDAETVRFVASQFRALAEELHYW